MFPNRLKVLSKIIFPISNGFYALILFALIFLLLITFWRFVFLISQFSELTSKNILLYFQSFGVALRLDLVIVSYLSLPIFLTTFIPNWGWNSQIYKKIYILYSLIIFFLYSLISIADLEFYKEMGTHLNILSWQSNAVSKELWIFIWQEYPVISYLLFTFCIVFLWIKLLKYFIPNQINVKHTLIVNFSYFFVSLLLLGTLSRGGLQQRPIDWGHAMFSNNHIANQIALNPLFNLGRSVIQLNSEKNIAKLIKYMDDDSALLITQNTIDSSLEVFTDSISFVRKIINPESINPNIVLVVLESFPGSIGFKIETVIDLFNFKILFFCHTRPELIATG